MWRLHLDSCPGPSSVRAGREQWLSREGAERGERKHEGAAAMSKAESPTRQKQRGVPKGRQQRDA